MSAKPMSSGDISSYCRTVGWLGREVRYLRAVGSTNDVALSAAGSGARAGLVVITDEQTRGRGRLGRRWSAPPGTSLLLSVLFRPPDPFLYHASRTMMICGLALVHAVTVEAQVQVALKWPNDLIHEEDGHWWKLAGMLSEVSLSSRGEPDALVVGIGLNANVPSAALPGIAPNAGSLLALSGKPVDRIVVLDRLLTGIETRYAAMLGGRDPLPAWREALAWLGQPVEIVGLGERVQGVALDVDEGGALSVLLQDGEVRTFTAGDVSLRPAPATQS